MGKSGRTFRKMFSEHLRAPSPIYDHANTTGHSTSVDNLSTGGGNHITSPELSRRAYGLMIHPLLGT